MNRPVLLTMQFFGSSKALFTVHIALVDTLFQVGDGHFTPKTSQQLMMPGTMQREQIAI